MPLRAAAPEWPAALSWVEIPSAAEVLSQVVHTGAGSAVLEGLAGAAAKWGARAQGIEKARAGWEEGLSGGVVDNQTSLRIRTDAQQGVGALGALRDRDDAVGAVLGATATALGVLREGAMPTPAQFEELRHKASELVAGNQLGGAGMWYELDVLVREHAQLEAWVWDAWRGFVGIARENMYADAVVVDIDFPALLKTLSLGEASGLASVFSRPPAPAEQTAAQGWRSAGHLDEEKFDAPGPRAGRENVAADGLAAGHTPVDEFGGWHTRQYPLERVAPRDPRELLGYSSPAPPQPHREPEDIARNRQANDSHEVNADQEKQSEQLSPAPAGPQPPAQPEALAEREGPPAPAQQVDVPGDVAEQASEHGSAGLRAQGDNLGNETNVDRQIRLVRQEAAAKYRDYLARQPGRDAQPPLEAAQRRPPAPAPAPAGPQPPAQPEAAAEAAEREGPPAPAQRVDVPGNVDVDAASRIADEPVVPGDHWAPKPPDDKLGAEQPSANGDANQAAQGDQQHQDDKFVAGDPLLGPFNTVTDQAAMPRARAHLERAARPGDDWNVDDAGWDGTDSVGASQPIEASQAQAPVDDPELKLAPTPPGPEAPAHDLPEQGELRGAQAALRPEDAEANAAEMRRLIDNHERRRGPTVDGGDAQPAPPPEDKFAADSAQGHARNLRVDEVLDLLGDVKGDIDPMNQIALNDLIEELDEPQQVADLRQQRDELHYERKLSQIEKQQWSPGDRIIGFDDLRDAPGVWWPPDYRDAHHAELNRQLTGVHRQLADLEPEERFSAGNGDDTHGLEREQRRIRDHRENGEEKTAPEPADAPGAQEMVDQMLDTPGALGGGNQDVKNLLGEMTGGVDNMDFLPQQEVVDRLADRPNLDPRDVAALRGRIREANQEAIRAVLRGRGAERTNLERLGFDHNTPHFRDLDFRRLLRRHEFMEMEGVPEVRIPLEGVRTGADIEQRMHDWNQWHINRIAARTEIIPRDYRLLNGMLNTFIDMYDFEGYAWGDLERRFPGMKNYLRSEMANILRSRGDRHFGGGWERKP